MAQYGAHPRHRPRTVPRRGLRGNEQSPGDPRGSPGLELLGSSVAPPAGGGALPCSVGDTIPLRRSVPLHLHQAQWRGWNRRFRSGGSSRCAGPRGPRLPRVPCRASTSSRGPAPAPAAADRACLAVASRPARHTLRTLPRGVQGRAPTHRKFTARPEDVHRSSTGSAVGAHRERPPPRAPELVVVRPRSHSVVSRHPSQHRRTRAAARLRRSADVTVARVRMAGAGPRPV